MKIIKNIDERYYPETGEMIAIKINGKVTLKDIAYNLNISYPHLWRKLNRIDYPNNAFSRMEVEKIQVMTGIKFNFH